MAIYRIVILLALCVYASTNVNANNYSQDPSSKSTTLTKKEQHQSNHNNDETTHSNQQQPNQRTTTPTRSFDTPISLKKKPKAQFFPPQQRCVQLGNIVTFTGTQLHSLQAHQFKIQTDNITLPITPISLSSNQIAFKLSEQYVFTAGHHYTIQLIPPRPLQTHNEELLKFQICPTSSNLQAKFTLQREKNQILAFSPVSQSQKVIQKATTKFSLKLIENHALNHLEYDLLVFHSDEENISETIRHLKTSFSDVIFDFNHHYYAATQPRQYAEEMIKWPTHSCPEKNENHSVSIGLIDGLPNINHPALITQNITIQSFLNGENLPDTQHATAIAGILVGQQTAQQDHRLLKNVHLLSAVTLRREEQQSLATAVNIVRSINWLLDKQVRLVNISLAGKENNVILEKVLAFANRKKMLFFAAVGNNNLIKQHSYPAALPNVFAITAVDAAQRLYQHANKGSYIDFAAPGVDIWTISERGAGKYRSGTSYASPYAVALAATYLAKEPTLSRTDIYDMMKADARDLGKTAYDNYFGWGLIQAKRTKCLQSTAPSH